MRISGDPKSPWYSSLACSCTVYLDGVMLQDCVYADEEQGEAECYYVDANGFLIYDGEFAQLVKRRGRVAIIYPGMNFDAWMSARTDRAHAEYMAAHAAGGIDYT